MTRMFTVEDFLAQYETATDEELMHVYSNPDDYTPEAEEAAKKLLYRRGGLEAAKERILQKKIADARQARINRAATAKAEAEDRKIKPRTVFGSVIGGAVASLAGTIVWGAQLLYAGGYIAEKVTLILGVGLFFICYGIVRLATGQSKKNAVVLVSSAMSTAISIIGGDFLFRHASSFHWHFFS